MVGGVRQDRFEKEIKRINLDLEKLNYRIDLFMHEFGILQEQIKKAINDVKMSDEK